MIILYHAKTLQKVFLLIAFLVFAIPQVKAQAVIKPNGDLTVNGHTYTNWAANDAAGKALVVNLDGSAAPGTGMQPNGAFNRPEKILPTGDGGIKTTMSNAQIELKAANDSGTKSTKVPVSATATISKAGLALIISKATGSPWVGVLATALPEILKVGGYKVGDGAKSGEIVLDGEGPLPATGNLEVNFGAATSPLGGGWYPADQGQTACATSPFVEACTSRGGTATVTYGWSSYYGKPSCGVTCVNGWSGGGFGSSRTGQPKCPDNSTAISGTQTCLCNSGYFETPGSAKQVCGLPAAVPRLNVDPIKIEEGLAANPQKAADVGKGLSDKKVDPISLQKPDDVRFEPLAGSPSIQSEPQISSKPISYGNGQPVMSGGRQVEATTKKQVSTTLVPKPDNPAQLDVKKVEVQESPTVQTSVEAGAQVATVTNTVTTTTTVNNYATTVVNTTTTTYNSTVNNSITPDSLPVSVTTKEETKPTVDPLEETGLCKVFPDILACQKLGELPEEPQLTTEERPFTLTPVSFGGSGSCPADKQLNFVGVPSITVPLNHMCMFADWLKPVILAVAWLVAAAIISESINGGAT